MYTTCVLLCPVLAASCQELQLHTHTHTHAHAHTHTHSHSHTLTLTLTLTHTHTHTAFSELLSRVLDLEIDDWEPALDSQMVVTVFQYAAFFLVQGISGIQKCLKDVAQERECIVSLCCTECYRNSGGVSAGFKFSILEHNFLS